MAKKAEEKKTKATEKVKKEKPEKAKAVTAPIAKASATKAKNGKKEPKASKAQDLVQDIPAEIPKLSIRERLIKRVNIPKPEVDSKIQEPSGNKGKKLKGAPKSAPNQVKKEKPVDKTVKSDDNFNSGAKPLKSSKAGNKNKSRIKFVIDNTIMTRGMSEKEITAMTVNPNAPSKDVAGTRKPGHTNKIEGQKKKGRNQVKPKTYGNDKIFGNNDNIGNVDVESQVELSDGNSAQINKLSRKDRRREKWKKKKQIDSIQEDNSISAKSIEIVQPIMVEEKHPVKSRKLEKSRPKTDHSSLPSVKQIETDLTDQKDISPIKNIKGKKPNKADVPKVVEQVEEKREQQAVHDSVQVSKKITKRLPEKQVPKADETPVEIKPDKDIAPKKDKRGKNKQKTGQNQQLQLESPSDEKVAPSPDKQKKFEKKGGKSQAKQQPDNPPKKKEIKKPRKKYKPLLSKAQKQDVFITNFLSRLENKLINELFLEKESSVLLAVSGGVDSIVLLDSMRILAEKHDFYIVVAHYNHNLRGKSADSDETFTGGIARKYDLEFSSAKGNVKKYAKKKSLSLEHAARVLRYQFLERTARNFHCEYIATAHTSDDSAETFLLNLIRGSGLTGLSGIQSKRPMGKNVILVRPLLDFRKEELIEYAVIRKLEWHEDESNYMLNYTRNKIRHELLPMLRQFNPSISDIINRSADLFKGADEFISGHIKIAIENVVFDKKPDRISLKISLLETFNLFLQGELIKLALDKHFQIPGASLNIVDRIINLMSSDTGTIFEINNELIAFKDRDIITISRKSIFTEVNASVLRTGIFKFNDYTLKLEEVPKSKAIISDDKNVEYLDMELVPAILSVRNWKDGDAFVPLGMKGTMKVSDFLTNSKISLVDKPDVLVLRSKSEIIWVIGHRINDKFKITDSTQKFLRAEIIKKRKKDEPA